MKSATNEMYEINMNLCNSYLGGNASLTVGVTRFSV